MQVQIAHLQESQNVFVTFARPAVGLLSSLSPYSLLFCLICCFGDIFDSWKRVFWRCRRKPCDFCYLAWQQTFANAFNPGQPLFINESFYSLSYTSKKLFAFMLSSPKGFLTDQQKLHNANNKKVTGQKYHLESEVAKRLRSFALLLSKFPLSIAATFFRLSRLGHLPFLYPFSSFVPILTGCNWILLPECEHQCEDPQSSVHAQQPVKQIRWVVQLFAYTLPNHPCAPLYHEAGIYEWSVEGLLHLFLRQLRNNLLQGCTGWRPYQTPMSRAPLSLPFWPEKSRGVYLQVPALEFVTLTPYFYSPYRYHRSYYMRLLCNCSHIQSINQAPKCVQGVSLRVDIILWMEMHSWKKSSQNIRLGTQTKISRILKNVI